MDQSDRDTKRSTSDRGSRQHSALGIVLFSQSEKGKLDRDKNRQIGRQAETGRWAPNW